MAPLNLVADRNLSDYESRVDVISKILSDHPGPARRFSVLIIFMCGIVAEVDRWLCSESLAGLEELEVTNLVKMINYTPPPHALTLFTPTLRMLRLRRCQFLDQFPPPNFPHLKHLILHEVFMSEEALQNMISGCTILESVSLHRMTFRRLCISSRTLRSITFYPLRWEGLIAFQELVIEYVPCLERLLPIYPEHGLGATIRVVRAPKLEILGFLSLGIPTFHLETTVFQKMIAVDMTTKMHTMKILALFIGPNLATVVEFLKYCFPCLERLHVILHDGDDIHNVRKFDLLDPIECLEFHLKKVVLRNCDGNKRPFIEFAKFFILNAKVLKQMEIRFLNKDECNNWMCYQHRELQVDDRASRDAQIYLGSATYAIPTNHGHAYDLSMADPFDKPFCRRDKCASEI